MQFNKRTVTAAFAVLAALMMIVIVIVAVPGGTSDGEVVDTDVAKIGDTGYATLKDAVAAAIAKNNADTEIIVLKDCSGSGIFVDPDKVGFILNLSGFTYTVTEPPVGSLGTENQAFHLEKNTDITIKNGTLCVDQTKGAGFKILVQNYCDLTLNNVTLDGTNLAMPTIDRYTLSNNNGTVNILGSTNIIAGTLSDSHSNFAFDVCAYASYAGATVTVNTTGTINGNIELSGSAGNTGTYKLNVTAGNFTGKFIESSNASKIAVSVTGGSFSDLSALKYTKSGADITLSANYTLTADLTVPAGVELTISKNVTLTIPYGKKIVNNGSMINSGIITGDGSIMLGMKGATLNNNAGSVLSTTVVVGTDEAVFKNITAGTNGITITYGSLIISGDYTNVGGVITITGTAIVSGTLENGATLELASGSTMNIGDKLIIEAGAAYKPGTADVKGATSTSVLDIEAGASKDGTLVTETVVEKVDTTGARTAMYRILLSDVTGHLTLAADRFFVVAGSNCSELDNMVISVDDGYRLVGWYDYDGNRVKASTVPAGNMELIATVDAVSPSDSVTSYEPLKDYANMEFLAAIFVLVLALIAFAAIVVKTKK